MSSMFITFLKMIISLMILCIKWIVILLIPFFFMCGVFFVYYRARGKKLPKKEHESTFKQRP